MMWCVALGWGCAALAHVHAVGLEVKQHGDQVTIEAYFDDDSPADDAHGTVICEEFTRTPWLKIS